MCDQSMAIIRFNEHNVYFSTYCGCIYFKHKREYREKADCSTFSLTPPIP
jgi:hypothetical protein